MAKHYYSYSEVKKIFSFQEDDTIHFPKLGVGLYISKGDRISMANLPTYDSIMRSLGLADQPARDRLFHSLLGFEASGFNIFTGTGFVPFTFHKYLKHIFLIYDTLYENKNWNEQSLSGIRAGYGDLVELKGDNGETVRYRVSNYHLINIDEPGDKHKNKIFEALAIPDIKVFAETAYGYEPVNLKKFPFYAKDDYKAASRLIVNLFGRAKYLQFRRALEVRRLEAEFNKRHQVLEREGKQTPYHRREVETPTMRSRPKIDDGGIFIINNSYLNMMDVSLKPTEEPSAMRSRARIAAPILIEQKGTVGFFARQEELHGKIRLSQKIKLPNN